MSSTNLKSILRPRNNSNHLNNDEEIKKPKRVTFALDIEGDLTKTEKKDK